MAEERAVCGGSGASLDGGLQRGGGRKAGEVWVWTERQNRSEETDAEKTFDRMPGPSDVISADEENSTDDELSDAPEPFPEAWVADENCYCDDNLLDEDDSNLHTDTIPSQPRPSFLYEPEDWDAEMLANTNPYDEEDLDGMSYSEHIAPIDDTVDSDGPYLPSLHHAASIQLKEACSVLNMNFEADQFEDADL